MNPLAQSQYYYLALSAPDHNYKQDTYNVNIVDILLMHLDYKKVLTISN